MSSTQPAESPALQVVRRFNDAFNRRDVNAVMELMTDDVVFENTGPAPEGTRVSGHTNMREHWRTFFLANPDALFEEEEIVAAGDRVVVRWTYRKQKDGKPWHLRGIDLFRVRDGRIAEKLSYVKG
jgi:ketosteroid isomerase-like protein